MKFNLPKTNDTARFTFFDLPGEPWLMVRPGGEENKAYFQAVLASQSKNRKRLMKGKLNAEMLVENRRVDRKLYPKHIDAGEWGGWQDEQGNEVPYTPAAFAELMQQLPNDLFDELRAFCNEPVNFREDDEPDLDDIEETAGN